MSRTFNRYNKNFKSGYPDSLKRKGQRNVQNILRAARVRDLSELDSEKFLDIEPRERIFQTASPIYED